MSIRRCIERFGDRCYRFFSTPIWVYMSAIIVAIIMLAISCVFNKEDSWWMNLLLNLGYGIIASTLVSLMIDLGATRRKKNQDSLEFSRMIAELKNECAELPSEMCTAVYEAFGYGENKKHSFEEWTEKLFSKLEKNVNQKQISEIKYMLQTVSEIKKKSCDLNEVMKLSLSNEFITDDIIKAVECVIHSCSRIEREERKEAYNNCKRLILEDLIPKIKLLFEDISVDFERKYNEEDYC